VAALTGMLGGSAFAAVAEAPWIGFPSFSGVSYAFDVSLAAPVRDRQHGGCDEGDGHDHDLPADERCGTGCGPT
jgi:hypothetical protein